MAVDDADLVVDERDLGDFRIEGQQRLAQREVERVHHAAAVGDGEFGRAVDAEFHRGLADRRVAVAVLAEAGVVFVEVEERLCSRRVRGGSAVRASRRRLRRSSRRFRVP